MIYSSGGGGGAQKVWETGPRSHSVLRKGLGASRSAVFWILTPPCTIGACAPAGNTCSHHAKVLDPRPPLHGRSLAVSTFPARTGSGHQVCPGQGRLLPECSRAQRGQQHGLVSDHCSLGPAGHPAASEPNWGGPDSPSGSERGAAITRLAGGRGEVLGLASAVPGGSLRSVVRGRSAATVSDDSGAHQSCPCPLGVVSPCVLEGRWPHTALSLRTHRCPSSSF